MTEKVTIADRADAINETFVLLPANYGYLLLLLSVMGSNLTAAQ